MATATITIEGFAAKDAALKFTPSGRPVLELDLPVTPQKRNDRGEWEDTGETAWYRCAVWGPMAETLQIPKGTLVQVVGTLKPRTWEKDGQQRTSLDVVVRSIGILREARGTTSAAAAGWSAPPAQQPQRQPEIDPWAPPSEPPF